LAICSAAKDLNAQVTTNVYSRVLKIKVGEFTGTAFTMDVDGRQYLITAKHMLSSPKQTDSIDIYRDNQWVQTQVKVVRCEDPIDIAVLIPLTLLTQTLPLEPVAEKHFFLGQDVYFVGFPFGLDMEGNAQSGYYPFAVVKKAIYSAARNENGGVVLLLDGYNNKGFSGGPIVCHDLYKANSPLYFAGVISGFLPEISPVMIPKKVAAGEDISKVEKWRLVKLKDGQNAVLNDTENKVALNTGIVIGYSIKHAIDLIRKNPIGPKIDQK